MIITLLVVTICTLLVVFSYKKARFHAENYTIPRHAKKMYVNVDDRWVLIDVMGAEQ